MFFFHEAIFQHKGRVVISSSNTSTRSVGILFGFLGLIQGVFSVEEVFLNDSMKIRWCLDEKYVRPVCRFLEGVDGVRKELTSPPLVGKFFVNDDGLFEEFGENGKMGSGECKGKVKKIVSFNDPVVSQVFEIESREESTE